MVIALSAALFGGEEAAWWQDAFGHPVRGLDHSMAGVFIGLVGLVCKWKFIVEFEDEETQEIAGTLGETLPAMRSANRGGGAASTLARPHRRDRGSRRIMRSMRGRRKRPD